MDLNAPPDRTLERNPWIIWWTCKSRLEDREAFVTLSSLAVAKGFDGESLKAAKLIVDILAPLSKHPDAPARGRLDV